MNRLLVKQRFILSLRVYQFTLLLKFININIAGGYTSPRPMYMFMLSRLVCVRDSKSELEDGWGRSGLFSKKKSPASHFVKQQVRTLKYKHFSHVPDKLRFQLGLKRRARARRQPAQRQLFLVHRIKQNAIIINSHHQTK